MIDNELIYDISARIPYDLIAEIETTNCYTVKRIVKAQDLHSLITKTSTSKENTTIVTKITPYLKKMEDMTNDELEEYRSFCTFYSISGICTYLDNYKSIDWLNKNMFDYRRLINKGLALKK